VEFTVNNVDYTQLTSNANMKAQFVDKCKEGIVQTVNAKSSGKYAAIAKSSVAITLTQGSVIVSAVVTAPAASVSKIETEMLVDTAALTSNVLSQVQTVSNINAVVSGSMTVAAPRVGSTAPSPVGACTWRFAGHGYCGPSPGLAGESSVRLGTWAHGDRDAAKAACCSSSLCGGFHFDSGVAPTEYVLLDVLGTPDGSDGTRRQCFEKVTPSDTDQPSSGAAPLGVAGAFAVAALAVLAFRGP